MGNKAWKDPIVEEISQIRKKLDKEFEQDPKGVMNRARNKITKAGFKIVPAPTSTPKKRKR